MAKKWYSFFVVTDDPTAGSSEPSAPGRAAPAPPLRRVEEMVPPEGAAPPLEVQGEASAVDVSAVYEAAKIVPPAHGYTVLKVAEMLQSEHIGSLPTDVKRKSILVALDAAGVKVDEIVEDAVRRDRALDTYERVLEKALDDLRARTAAENARIEDEINQRVAELRARIDENNRRTSTEQAEFLAWRARKHEEEKTIAEAVSYFVSENPITSPKATVNDQGDADVR